MSVQLRAKCCLAEDSIMQVHMRGDVNPACGCQAPPERDVIGGHALSEENLGAIAQDDVVGVTFQKNTDDLQSYPLP